MKKLTAMFLCFLFTFFAACGLKEKEADNGSDTTAGGYAPTIDNPLDASGEQTLEIAVFKDHYIYPALTVMIGLFNRQYPNININVTVVGTEQTYANELKELMMMQNYKPDLILAPPEDAYMKDPVVKGMLADIYGTMYADPYFDEGDYFMQAIHAFSQDGKLHEFPINVKPVFFAVNNQISDNLTERFVERSQVNFFDLLDIFRSADTDGRWLFHTFEHRDATRYTFSLLYNELTGTYCFTDPMYAEMLAIVTDGLHNQPEGMRRSRESAIHITQINEKDDGNRFLFQRHPFSALQYILPLSSGLPLFSGSVPLTDGRGRVILDEQDLPVRFSMHADSDKKALAWELIKFFSGTDYLEDQIKSNQNDRYYFYLMNKNYMPVYKPNLKIIMEYLLGPDFNNSGLQTYKLQIALFEEDRIGYLMEFFEKIMENEMVYVPDHWQISAITNALIS
ncbi:MAG: hypothetical protein FWE82_10265, partial [Defluviitaleaceae bacterium]|nr:hypothetical protein [Defluviitaleaceae bacterium]